MEFFFYRRSAHQQKLYINLFIRKKGFAAYKNPFKPNFWKAQNFAPKSEGGVNFTKEIPLDEISENLKILLKLEKKFKKGV